MRVFAAAVGGYFAGWIVGLASSRLYLSNYHSGDPNIGGDWSAAITAATIGLILMVPFVYLPVLFWIRSSPMGHGAWLYLLVGACTCAVPWLVVGGLWVGPGVIFTLGSAEALFVYSIFGPAGAAFALVFWWVHVRHAELVRPNDIDSGVA